MLKNHQRQHKGKPHTQEKFQDAAISVENAVTNSVDTSEIETSCVRVCVLPGRTVRQGYQDRTARIRLPGHG
jgi:hypothetical protein